MPDPLYHYSENSRRVITIFIVLFLLLSMVFGILFLRSVTTGAWGVGLWLGFLLAAAGMVVAWVYGGVNEATVTCDHVIWRIPHRVHGIDVGHVHNVDVSDIAAVERVVTDDQGLGGSCFPDIAVIETKSGKRVPINCQAVLDLDKFIEAVEKAMAMRARQKC